MKHMHLPEVEGHSGGSRWGVAARAMHAAGVPVPQIFHLLDFKPQWTELLAQFTQSVMRGPSPLTPGQRELIAAFTSRVDNCDF